VAADSAYSLLKRLIVGRPIPSHLAHHERLSRFTGLAVLSSDPLSSVAYATEEVLRVLILVGPATLSLANPIAFVIATILAIVVFSYRQTIHAYPSGGGAYIVARENLGELPSLIAAGALLIDYVLTVSVSVAAGVAAITSAMPSWHVNRVEVGSVGRTELIEVPFEAAVDWMWECMCDSTFDSVAATQLRVPIGAGHSRLSAQGSNAGCAPTAAEQTRSLPSQ